MADHSNLLRRYLAEYAPIHLSAVSIPAYRSTLSRYEAQHGPLHAATPQKISLFIAGYQNRDSRRTQQNQLKNFFTWACRDGKVPRNPFDRLDSIKPVHHEPHPADRRLLDDALAEAKRNRPRVYVQLMLAAAAGMRAREVAAVRVEHVDFSAGTIAIYQSKGNKDRVVPLFDELRGPLFDWIGSQRTGPLFPTPTPTRGQDHVTAHSVSQAAGQFLARYAIKGIHSLRHSFGTELALEGMNLIELQRIMGHADPKTTMGYVQWAEAHRASTDRTLRITGKSRMLPTPAAAPEPPAIPAGYVSTADVAQIVAQAVAAAMAAQAPAAPPALAEGTLAAGRRRLRVVRSS